MAIATTLQDVLTIIPDTITPQTPIGNAWGGRGCAIAKLTYRTGNGYNVQTLTNLINNLSNGALY